MIVMSKAECELKDPSASDHRHKYIIPLVPMVRALRGLHWHGEPVRVRMPNQQEPGSM